MAQTTYAVTYRGKQNGSASPVTIDPVGVFLVGKPAIIDNSKAQSCGFPDAEYMVTWLWHPDWGIHTSIHKDEEKERWEVQELTAEQAEELRARLYVNPPVVTETAEIAQQHEAAATTATSAAPGEPHKAQTAHSTKEVK